MFGSGELEPRAHSALGLFDSPDRSEPDLLIERPESTPMLWSEFPPVGQATAALARIRLEEGSPIRGSFWGSTRDRGFQLRRSATSGLTWIDRGVRVEIVGRVAEGLLVRRASELSFPRDVEVTVRCSEVAYEPVAMAPPPDDEADAGLGESTAHVDVHESANGPIGLRLVLERPLPVKILEARAHRTKVRWHARGLGFEGWVDEDLLDQRPFARTADPAPVQRQGPRPNVPRLVVVRRTALWLGDRDRRRFSDATVEPGTRLDLDGDDGPYLRVRVSDSSIRATQPMWIARDDARGP